MCSEIVYRHLGSLSTRYGVPIVLTFSRFEGGSATVRVDITGMGHFDATAAGPCPDIARINAIDSAVDSSPLGAEG